MLFDSLSHTAHMFLLFSNFRNMPGKVKPFPPPSRSFLFETFQDSLHDQLQMPTSLTKHRAGRRDVAKLPACISSLLLLQMTWNATVQNQGLFCAPAESYTGELGQPRTKPWIKGGCTCLPACWDIKPLMHLLRYSRWVLKQANAAWWDKIRLLCHVAPQQQDFWDAGITSLIPLKPNRFLQTWYRYLLCALPISNLF